MYVCGSIRACCACRTASSSRPAVIWRPPPSTSVSLSTQSPGDRPVSVASTTRCNGVRKCGRMNSMTRNRVAPNATRVAVIAATVRRNTSPASTALRHATAPKGSAEAVLDQRMYSGISAAINDAYVDEVLGLDGCTEGTLAIAGCGPAAATRSPFDPVFEPYVLPHAPPM